MSGHKLRTIEQLQKEYDEKTNKQAPAETRRGCRRAKKNKAKKGAAAGQGAQVSVHVQVQMPSTAQMSEDIKSMLRGPVPKQQQLQQQQYYQQYYQEYHQQQQHQQGMVAYNNGAVAVCPPLWVSSGIRSSGTVKKLVEGKGFGFVEPDVYVACFGDVFLHFSDMKHGSSDAGRLQVGSRVRFGVQIDWAGRGRAMDVVSEAEEVAELMKRAGLQENKIETMPPSPTYTLSEMLSVGKAMQAPTSAKPSRRRTGVTSAQRKLGIRTVNWPEWLSAAIEGEEDVEELELEERTLDDEVLIGLLETRLSAESGMDSKNAETFGEDCELGWTFEEAVQANFKLNGWTSEEQYQ